MLTFSEAAFVSADSEAAFVLTDSEAVSEVTVSVTFTGFTMTETASDGFAMHNMLRHLVAMGEKVVLHWVLKWVSRPLTYLFHYISHYYIRQRLVPAFRHLLRPTDVFRLKFHHSSTVTL